MVSLRLRKLSLSRRGDLARGLPRLAVSLESRLRVLCNVSCCFALGATHSRSGQSLVFSVHACSSQLVCGAMSVLFRHFNYPHSGNLAHLSLLCQPSFRSKVGANDIMCT